MEKRFEYTNCDLCGGKNHSLVYEVKGVEGEEIFRLIKCDQCRLTFVNPRPLPNEISRYYPDQTYYAYQDNQNQKKSLRKKFKELVLESLMGERKNNLLQKLIKSLFDSRLMVIVPSALKGKILDIGCGNGEFLINLQKYGWDTYGVEINEKACAIAQRAGINVFCGELTQIKYSDEFFDVVVMNQVLEHVFSPSSYLKEINRILKPQGLLIICIPNIDSFESRIFKEKWAALEVPRHLYHFNLETLTALLGKNDFVVVEIKSKVFGLPFKGIKNQLKEIPTKFRIISGLKILFLLLVKKPLAFCFSKDKKGFGFFISVYAQKTNIKKEKEVELENIIGQQIL